MLAGGKRVDDRAARIPFVELGMLRRDLVGRERANRRRARAQLQPGDGRERDAGHAGADRELPRRQEPSPRTRDARDAPGEDRDRDVQEIESAAQEAQRPERECRDRGHVQRECEVPRGDRKEQ